MALEIQRRVGDRLADGIAVVPRGSAVTAERDSILKKKIRFVESSHPVPDESSERAAILACEMLHRATADDLVIVAISGGASAMFTLPAEGLTLADKIAVNEALLKAGASIRELNTVRKHLSAVKGGRLLRHCGGARVLGLILSDVPGNDLATIGFGAYRGRLEQLRRRRLGDEAARRVGARAGSGALVPRASGGGRSGRDGEDRRSDSRARDQRDNRRQQSGSGSSRARRGRTWVSSLSAERDCRARPTMPAARSRRSYAQSRRSACAWWRAASLS